MARQPLAPFAPIAGRWDFPEASASYLDPDEVAEAPYGLAVSALRLRNGELHATVTFEGTVSVGRLVIGYSAGTGSYYSVGLGGYKFAYIIDEFKPGRGWGGIRAAGHEKNLGRRPGSLHRRLR